MNQIRWSVRTRLWIGIIAVLTISFLAWGVVAEYPGVLGHPLVPALLAALFGLALLLTVELVTWQEKSGYRIGKLIALKVGEALLVVAVVVVVFEFPHFRHFYEGLLKGVLTKTDFVEGLSPQRQRELVESTISSHLATSGDSSIARAFARDLYRELDEGQYVMEEQRSLEKEWVDSTRTAMRSMNAFSRLVRALGAKQNHRFIDYVGPNSLYAVSVRGVECVRFTTDPNGQAQLVLPDPDRCTAQVSEHQRGHRIQVQVPLLRGIHAIERVIRRSSEPPFSGTTFGLDYFTQSFKLRYTYPPDITLEVYGHGDFEAVLDGAPIVSAQQGDVDVFTKDLPDEWFGRGSNIAVFLAPVRTAVSGPARPHARN